MHTLTVHTSTHRPQKLDKNGPWVSFVIPEKVHRIMARSVLTRALLLTLVVLGVLMVLGMRDRETSSKETMGDSRLRRSTAEQAVRLRARDSSPMTVPVNRPKVAITVLITGNSKRTPTALLPSMDGMGVLKYSIKRVMSGKYDIDFIAMVHETEEKWLPIIEIMGWTVKKMALPFQPSEVRNPQIAKEIVDDGAIGIAETIKLEVLRWREYQAVVSVDVDVFFHRNFDELFEIKKSLGWTEGGWATERMNGGFLVFHPSDDGEKHYTAMIETMKEGDFRSGTGWRGSGIGWTYGGRTVQGVLPYYYLKIANNSHQQIERCRYNNMVQLERCKKWPLEDVTSNHFTGDCTKPWWCGVGAHPTCKEFHRRWREAANNFTKLLLGVPANVCENGKYEPVSKVVAQMLAEGKTIARYY